MIVKFVIAFILLKVLTLGLTRKSLNTANKQGRWFLGWMIFFGIIGIHPRLIGGNYSEENYYAMITVGSLFLGLLGYITGFVWFKLRQVKRKNIKINEKHWEMAENEFNSDRKSGVWAESYSEAKGDENLAKAIYLKKRAIQFASQLEQHEAQLEPQSDFHVNTDDVDKFVDSSKDTNSLTIPPWLKVSFVLFGIVAIGYYINIYMKEVQAKKDYEAGFYKLAAEEGNADAQLTLGNAYFNGEGVAQDYMEAMNWWKKSAEQGNELAIHNIGYMYDIGKGVAKDYKEAIVWYLKSAEMGNANAQNSLGVMYEYGKGCTKDYKEATKWYFKSAEQGNSYAQANLGDMYENGKGFSQDYKEAINWYLKAAEKGNTFAQNHLGLIYSTGQGVTKDDNQAISWLKKSAKQGDEDAQKLLMNLYNISSE